MNIKPQDTPAILNFIAQYAGIAETFYCTPKNGEIETSRGYLDWGMYTIARIKEIDGKRVIEVDTSTHGSAIGQRRAACIKRYFTDAGIPFITK